MAVRDHYWQCVNAACRNLERQIRQPARCCLCGSAFRELVLPHVATRSCRLARRRGLSLAMNEKTWD